MVREYNEQFIPRVQKRMNSTARAIISRLCGSQPAPNAYAKAEPATDSKPRMLSAAHDSARRPWRAGALFFRHFRCSRRRARSFCDLLPLRGDLLVQVAAEVVEGVSRAEAREAHCDD